MNEANLSGSNKSNRLLFTVCAVIVIIALGAAGYFYKQASDLRKNPENLAAAKAKELIEKVSKLIVLPQGEEPTVATVSDPEKLKDNPFLEKAKKGDVILIYPKAQKAYLYDPVANKVVDVGSVNFGQQPANANANTNTPVSPKGR